MTRGSYEMEARAAQGRIKELQETVQALKAERDALQARIDGGIQMWGYFEDTKPDYIRHVYPSAQLVGLCFAGGAEQATKRGGRIVQLRILIDENTENDG